MFDYKLQNTRSVWFDIKIKDKNVPHLYTCFDHIQINSMFSLNIQSIIDIRKWIS